MRRNLLRTEDEREIFSRKHCQGMSSMSEVTNEDANDADGAEESTNFREVAARSPVNYLVHTRFFG